MKKFKFGFFLICTFVFTGLIFSSINCAGTGTMNGSVRMNISDQPNWGPTGYDRVEYYYLPDIDSYYSVSERQYIYWDGSDWRHSVSLPSHYSNYDPYNSYKIVINEERPFRYNDSHRTRYRTYKGRRDQVMIRDSRDQRYFVNRDRSERATLSVSFNIGNQPVWGPTGYDRADYYYIPDIDSYYSISDRQYIYRDGSMWRHSESLPSSYVGYDPYNSYKVVINEDKPYLNNDDHRTKYRMMKGSRNQQMIRDSQDTKYFVNKDHPKHDNWVRDQER